MQSFIAASSMARSDANAPPADPNSRIWITLITQSTYLPGLVLLVHTLYKHRSKHPIVVQYTSSLEEDAISCLRDLKAFYSLLHIQYVETVPLPNGLTPIASRFDETLTKLRAFQPFEDSKTAIEPALASAPGQVCFLDADIMIFRNLDDIFDIPRPGPDWIAAHHACTCNVDEDPWAPPEWTVENCPNTSMSHPSALDAPIPSTTAEGARPTYQLLNSGVFVCTPSLELWNRIQDFLFHDERVKTFTFPDQNFLDTFFKEHWIPIGWQYNAFKTHRYWHANAWRDEEVRALHYVVDKPWESKVSEDGTAGYLGRDGVTHSWWRKEYEEWGKWIANRDGENILDCVKGHVCVDSKLGQTRFGN